MSDVQQQGQSVPIEKIVEKLRNKIAEQAVQIAMLESYIDVMQESNSPEVPNVGN